MRRCMGRRQGERIDLHHTAPARLNPSHALISECWTRIQSLFSYCCFGDFSRVGLVDCYGVFVVECADLAVWRRLGFVF